MCHGHALRAVFGKHQVVVIFEQLGDQVNVKFGIFHDQEWFS